MAVDSCYLASSKYWLGGRTNLLLNPTRADPQSNQGNRDDVFSMKLLDLTTGEATLEIALDEALLESAENGDCDEEVLRVWQPKSPIVVLGRSSPIDKEVNRAACETLGVEIVRRCSGGATILASPGCLMYAVLLSYQRRPKLKMIDHAHRFVMSKIRDAVAACGVETEIRGICDLAIGDRKVSGNALRCRRSWFIYHGTLICQPMDLSLVMRCLGNPQRQPAYRKNRTHTEFLTRLPIEPKRLSQALQHEWKCESQLLHWPARLTRQLAENKYSDDNWTQKV